MRDILVGINVNITPDPDSIKKSLQRVCDDGFDVGEVTLDKIPLIIFAEINREWVDYLKNILNSYPLKYSAHIGRDVDLRDTARYELHKKALFSSIEACSLLGANPLVVHYEKQSKDSLIEERFLAGYIEAADYAAKFEITLCMENIEVDRVEPVIKMIEQVARPNFRMTFDTGHAWLASKYFHFDFLEALQKSLPVLHHIHLSDNVGVYEELRLTDRPRYDALPHGYRLTFGRGDIHLPPFYGKIPFHEIFKLLKDYRGIFLCEYNSHYSLPFNRKIQGEVRKAIQTARTPL